MFRELLGKSVVSGSRLVAVVALAFYAAGIIVLVLGVRWLIAHELSVEQLFLGMLGVLSVSLQLIILGFLVDIRGRILARDAAAK